MKWTIKLGGQKEENKIEETLTRVTATFLECNVRKLQQKFIKNETEKEN